MEVENDKFVRPISWTNKLLLKFMVCSFTLCLILPTFSLVQGIFSSMSPAPFLLPTIETIFDGVTLLLLLAISFKMITLVFKHTAPQPFMVPAAILLSQGFTYFLHKGENLKAADLMVIE